MSVMNNPFHQLMGHACLDCQLAHLVVQALPIHVYVLLHDGAHFGSVYLAVQILASLQVLLNCFLLLDIHC